jgi:hypothetical protein
MKKKLTTLSAVLAFFVTVILFVGNTASAGDITVTNVFKYRANISPSETGHTAGDRFGYGAYVVPNGDNGTSGYLLRANGTLAPLLFLPFDTAPNEFYGETAYNPNYNNSWPLKFTNINSSNNPQWVQTPTTFNAPVVPLASSVTIAGSGTQPTFSWTYGNGFTPDALTVKIWDLEKTVNNNSSGYSVKDIIYARTLPNTQDSFTVPPSWTPASGNTQSLQEGHQYSVGLYAEIARTDAQGHKLPINSSANILSLSMSFFDFVPLPANAPPEVSLPTTTPPSPSNPEPVYTFHTTVVAGQTIFVDPLVAIGYDYQIGQDDPDFASVKLPTGIGDNLFDLYLYDGTNYYKKAELTGGVTYNFDSGGVDRFRILGIEPYAGLDPNNPTAFITGLSFEGSGQFTGTMTPISQDYVPEPTTMLLLGLGLVGVAGARRKFKK